MDDIEKIPHTCSTCAFWVEAWRIENSVCWQEEKTKKTLPHYTCDRWKDKNDRTDDFLM